MFNMTTSVSVPFTLFSLHQYSLTTVMDDAIQAHSQGGSLGAEEPPFQIKGPQFYQNYFVERSTILHKRTTQLKCLAMGLQYCDNHMDTPLYCYI